MPAPTFLDLAASIDRGLKRNINWPYRIIPAGVAAISLVDYYLEFDASGGNITATLPSAVTAKKGMGFWLLRSDGSANTVTIAGTGGQTINGAGSVGITSQYGSINVVSNGTNWVLYASPAAFALSPDVLWTFAGQLSTDQNAALYQLKARRPMGFIGFDVNARVAPTGAPILVDWAINNMVNPALRVTIPIGLTYGETIALQGLATNDEIRPVVSGVGSQAPGQTIVMRARGL